jgi:hypothetical protein
MAARLEARGVRGASGVDPMPPDLTFAALGAVLPSPEPHVLLATASWPAFAAGLPPGAARLYSVLAGRAPAPDAAPGQGAGSFAARVKARPLRERRNALQEHIQQEVAKVLGLAMSQAPAPDVPLMQAGVDSLMSVHVRNALQASLEVQLPVTVLFDNPTISLLADHLARLLSSDGGEKTSETSPEDLESMLNELESLPEEEVARRLRE